MLLVAFLLVGRVLLLAYMYGRKNQRYNYIKKQLANPIEDIPFILYPLS